MVNKGRFVIVGSPDDEETEQQPRLADADVPLVRGMSVAGQKGSCMGAVGGELSKCRCSTGVVVADGETRGRRWCYITDRVCQSPRRHTCAARNAISLSFKHRTRMKEGLR